MKNGLFEASDADHRITTGYSAHMVWPSGSPTSEVSETIPTISLEKANALIPQLLEQRAGDGEGFTEKDLEMVFLPKGQPFELGYGLRCKVAERLNTKLRALRAADKAEIERLRAELEVWKQQCATSGEVIYRLSGRANNA